MASSLILGFFDGVHIAHRAVIQSALNQSSIINKTVLITFKSSPAEHFTNNVEYIMPRKDSLERIKLLGVNEIVELDFPQIAKMSAMDYLEYICSKFNPAYISTGFNHTFGYNKTGNSDFLYKYQDKFNYKYICTEPQIVGGKTVSSTLIKQYIKDGNIPEANKLLETNFSIEGTVKKGAQIGRTIGFPTANIDYPENIVRIPFGVYKVLYKNMPAILNWGIRPTVHNTSKPIAEIHIPNFNQDLYRKNIKVNIIEKIRDEIQFSDLNELKVQIEKDIRACLEL